MKFIFSESLLFELSFDDFFIIFGWFFTILWPYEKKKVWFWLWDSFYMYVYPRYPDEIMSLTGLHVRRFENYNNFWDRTIQLICRMMLAFISVGRHDPKKLARKLVGYLPVRLQKKRFSCHPISNVTSTEAICFESL